MSAPMGGKKSGGSSNSSMVITPASTPVNTMSNGQQASPPPNNAPKYGTLVPNRIFVGGISANTTETELLQLFSQYGTVKAAKIIQDRAGVSKGYGFITFESEDDAKRLQRDQDNITLRERKLNIAPAIKKQFFELQPFSRAFDGSSPPAVAPGFAPNFFPPGSMPFFQGGLAYYPQPPSGPADPAAQPPAVFQKYISAPSVYPPQSAPPQAAPYQPVMFPHQPIYMPQQYPMPMPCDFNYYANGGASMYGNGGGQNNGQPAITQGGAIHPQRPNSPPRQCYAPMQSTAAGGYPTQDVYYANLPMYQLEGGALYADPNALEAMGIGSGAVPEEYQQQPQDDYNTQSQHKGGVGVVMRAPAQQQPQVQQPPQPSSQQQQQSQGQPKPPSQPPTPQLQIQQVQQPPPSAGEQRQTATPVVSLLSLDHQQEKDLLSMQSGRRRKPPPSTPPAVQMHHYGLSPHQVHNGYSPYAAAPLEFHYSHIGYAPNHNLNFSLNHPAAPKITNGDVPLPRPHSTGGAHSHSNPNNTHSTSSNPNPKRVWNSNYHHQRADVYTPGGTSNVGVGVVVEDISHPQQHQQNVNYDKRRYSQPNLIRYGHAYTPNQQNTNTARGYNYNYQPNYSGGMSTTTSNTSYPAHKRRVFIASGKSQYRNNRQQFDNNNTYRHNSNTYGAPPLLPAPPPSITNNNNNIPATQAGKQQQQQVQLQTSTTPPGGGVPQQRSTPSPGAAFVSQIPPIPQHFVAPSRHRSRRTVRRGGGLGECGAGDAPLTSADGMADACNKMDSLKL